MPKTPRALYFILILGLLLRLPGLGQSVWLDELMTSNLNLGNDVLLLKSLVMDTHPPVYFVFISYWNRLFGDSELFLRLPALLFGLASIPLLFALASRLLNPRAGLLVAFLLAVSPVHIWYSTEARPYTANVLLVLASSLSLLRLTESPPRRLATTAYFLCALGLAFVHYYAVTLVFGFSLVAWWGRVPNAKRIHYCNAAILALVGTYLALKLSASPMRTEANYLKPFSLLAWYKLYFQWFATGNGFNPVILPAELLEGAKAVLREWVGVVLQVVYVVLFLVGLGTVFHRVRRTGREGLESITAPVLVLSIPVFLLLLPKIGLSQTYTERSALSTLPFFLILLAAGLARFESSIAWRRIWAGTLIVSSLTLLTHLDLRGTWTVYKPHPDWRGAAAFLGAELDAGANGRPLFSDYESPLALSYYDKRVQEVSIQTPPTKNLQQLRGFVRRMFGEEGAMAERVSGLVERNLEQYARGQADRWQQHEMVVYPLPGGDLSSLRLKQRTPDGIFYVLFHQVPGQETYLQHPVLRRGDFEVLREERFDSLILFKLKSRNWVNEVPPRAPDLAQR